MLPNWHKAIVLSTMLPSVALHIYIHIQSLKIQGWGWGGWTSGPSECDKLPVIGSVSCCSQIHRDSLQTNWLCTFILIQNVVRWSMHQPTSPLHLIIFSELHRNFNDTVAEPLSGNTWSLSGQQKLNDLNVKHLVKFSPAPVTGQSCCAVNSSTDKNNKDHSNKQSHVCCAH